MKTKWLSSKRVASSVAISASSMLLCACGDERPSTPVEAVTGTGSLVISATGSDVAGFQIEVARPSGEPVTSRFVPVDATRGSGEASTLVTLLPGAYVVTATPFSAPGTQAPGCSPSSSDVTVRASRTSEVTLISRCDARRGGISVTAGTNFEPELTSVRVDPSTSVERCEPITITFDATDRDGDPIACDIALGPADPTPVSAMPGESESSVRCVARIEAPAEGDPIAVVRACDDGGCASLEVPLHVSGGSSCTPGCDDGNPCTTDEATEGGVCRHSPIADGTLCSGGNLRVKLLGFNDFHGQIEAGRRVANRPVGGAAVLASYFAAAQAGMEDQTVIVHAGDHVGASPPASALLQDEPAISFLNLIANSSCSALDKLNPACNIVGTLGNHEFDEGEAELLRLLMGGNFPSGPFLEDPYPGASFPYVSSNVVDAITGAPVLRPYVTKRLHGVPVAFIGAVLRTTPTIVTPTGVAGLRFLDEADAINSQVPELVQQGVHSIVVTIHQGGFQASYTGPTRPTSMLMSGPEILDIVRRLDDEIDVVVSGHTHAFTNALIPNRNGKLILVTQAFSASTAYADIDLQIDPVSRDVVSKTASIVTTFADVGPGLTPDPRVAALVRAATDRVGPLVNRVIGAAPSALTRSQNAAGESALGDLVADSQLAAMGTELVFMNPGGIRADLDPGEVTFGDLFTIQPFGNTLVRMNLTGAQVVQVLEQQWLGQTSPRILQIAGFDYTWDPARPVGSRIVEVRVRGVAIDLAATYSVTCNNFLATGGDGFTAFIQGTNQIGGPVDLDALIEFVGEHSPLATPIGNRIRLAH